MRACARCGQENPEGFRFCGACGAPLEEADAPREVRKTVTVVRPDGLDGARGAARPRNRAARLHLRRGRLEDAERVVDRSLDVAATTDFWQYRGEGHEVPALILSAAGRRAEATEALETAVQAYRDKGATVAERRARALFAEL